MELRQAIKKYPVSFYFAITFIISWTGAFLVVAAKLVHHEPIPKFDGILMFPAMLLGPLIASFLLTYVTSGKPGVKALVSKLGSLHARPKWLVSLLIPPAAILITLFFMAHVTAGNYTPNFFIFGLLFGIPAGLLEEIGWMGFAFPEMMKKQSAVSAGLKLGMFWGIWHLPVIDFLGTASPHGKDWLLYFISFIVTMMAMRLIITWIYCNTKSLLLCQLMHISSTGFLVVLSPSHINTVEEPMWYFLYALLLWTFVIILITRYGRNLTSRPIGSPLRLP